MTIPGVDSGQQIGTVEVKIRGTDILALVAIGLAGLAAIQYLLRNPDKAREIHMRCLLTTQRICNETADKFRYYADRAGTEYNRVRV